MTGRLNGTTAVVTGASSGIGAATAHALAAEGATVALLARRRDRLDELAAALGDRVSVHPTDVSDEAAVRSSLEAVVATHGGIDVLVNNAGFGKIEPVVDAEWSNWKTMVDVNVLGVFAAAMAATPHLVKAATGERGVADMITVSSVAGRKVVKGTNVYAATKHAVGAFSDGLRQELAAQHVRVGLIEPGLVRTELTENPASGTAEIRDTGYDVMEASDIADAIVYAVTRPAHVAISEILIRPTEQTR